MTRFDEEKGKKDWLLLMHDDKRLLPFLSNLCFGFGYFLNDNLNTFWDIYIWRPESEHKQPTYPRDINLCQQRKYGNILNLLGKLENDQIDKIENGYE